MNNSSKFREEGDSQEHHIRFTSSCGCWTYLELVGRCSERGFVSQSLLLRPGWLWQRLFHLELGSSLSQQSLALEMIRSAHTPLLSGVQETWESCTAWKLGAGESQWDLKNPAEGTESSLWRSVWGTRELFESYIMIFLHVILLSMYCKGFKFSLSRPFIYSGFHWGKTIGALEFSHWGERKGEKKRRKGEKNNPTSVGEQA